MAISAVAWGFQSTAARSGTLFWMLTVCAGTAVGGIMMAVMTLVLHQRRAFLVWCALASVPLSLLPGAVGLLLMWLTGR
ncbi:MAG: hypothetical protein HY293_01120 [Planctomycetes bacterium]|nr:hypothetical protein [Planctomycetota bacterium]